MRKPTVEPTERGVGAGTAVRVMLPEIELTVRKRPWKSNQPPADSKAPGRRVRKGPPQPGGLRLSPIPRSNCCDDPTKCRPQLGNPPAVGPVLPGGGLRLSCQCSHIARALLVRARFQSAGTRAGPFDFVMHHGSNSPRIF